MEQLIALRGEGEVAPGWKKGKELVTQHTRMPKGMSNGGGLSVGKGAAGQRGAKGGKTGTTVIA